MHYHYRSHKPGNIPWWLVALGVVGYIILLGMVSREELKDAREGRKNFCASLVERAGERPVSADAYRHYCLDKKENVDE